MSFKKFSLAQNASGKNASGDKPKVTALADRPAAQPDEKAAAVAPAPKP